jgi:hypothetical protein
VEEDSERREEDGDEDLEEGAAPGRHGWISLSMGGCDRIGIREPLLLRSPGELNCMYTRGGGWDVPSISRPSLVGCWCSCSIGWGLRRLCGGCAVLCPSCWERRHVTRGFRSHPLTGGPRQVPGTGILQNMRTRRDKNSLQKWIAFMLRKRRVDFCGAIDS